MWQFLCFYQFFFEISFFQVLLFFFSWFLIYFDYSFFKGRLFPDSIANVQFQYLSLQKNPSFFKGILFMRSLFWSRKPLFISENHLFTVKPYLAKRNPFRQKSFLILKFFCFIHLSIRSLFHMYSLFFNFCLIQSLFCHLFFANIFILLLSLYYSLFTTI